MEQNQYDCGVTIGTISGGIVNFGGAIYISPITVTKTNSGSNENSQTSEETETNDMNSSSQTMNTFSNSLRAMLK